MKKNKIITIEKLCLSDNLTKFCSKNIFLTPKLEQIKMRINLKEFLEQTEINSLDKKDSTFRIKLFIVFYLMFLQDPLLKNKLISTRRNKNFLNPDNFFIESIVIKKNQIFNFLGMLFIETLPSSLKDYSLTNFISLENSKSFTFLYRLNVRLRDISDFDYFFSSSLLFTDLKEFQIPIEFFFKTQDEKIIVKTMPLFWLT